MLDAAPYNDVMCAAFLAPGSSDSYTSFTAATNNSDVSLGSTTFGNYQYHSFSHFNSMLSSLVNVNAVPANFRQAPRMRFTSFCVEITNLSQIASMNGALRCCRISTPTQNPGAAGTSPTFTAPWTAILNSFYENPDTQHVVSAEASHALCAHALPTQLLSGQFYSPTAEGLTAFGGTNATSAWAGTVYDVATGNSGGVDQDVLWTTLRFVVDSLSASATIEFVFKATAEFLIPPDSFLVGAGVPRPIGDFTPVLKRASLLMKKPPVTVAPGGGRSVAGVTGLMPQSTKGQQQQKKQQKSLRGSTTSIAPRTSAPRGAPGPPPGYLKTLRAAVERIAQTAANPAVQGMAQAALGRAPRQGALRDGLRRIRRR